MQNLHDLLAQEAADETERDGDRAAAVEAHAGLLELLRAIAEQSPGEWRSRAACRGMDVEMFHKPGERVRNAAIATCRACPVQSECLAWVLSIPGDQDKAGIYAGTTWQERRQLRRQRADAA
jgi:hypothetical protein